MLQGFLDFILGRNRASTPVPPPPSTPSWRADGSHLQLVEPEPEIKLDARITDEAAWTTELTRVARAGNLERAASLLGAYGHVTEEFKRRGLRDRVISIVVVEHQELVLRTKSARGRMIDDFTYVVVGVMRSATSGPQIITVDDTLRVYMAHGKIEAITPN